MSLPMRRSAAASLQDRGLPPPISSSSGAPRPHGRETRCRRTHMPSRAVGDVTGRAVVFKDLWAVHLALCHLDKAASLEASGA